MSKPRGVEIAPDGSILFIQANTNQITRFQFGTNNQSGTVSILGSQSGLNHGIKIHGDYLYASSSTTVYRYDILMLFFSFTTLSFLLLLLLLFNLVSSDGISTQLPLQSVV